MNSWEHAKAKLDTTPFPSDYVSTWSTFGGGENHSIGKIDHPLTTYVKVIGKINGYEVHAKYNFCEDCREIRNKRLALINNEDYVVYIKNILVHGKSV